MKTNTIGLMIMMVSLPLLLTQCKSKQEMAGPAGETLLEMYCSGPEYQSTSDQFRASSVAESANQANSKRMALSNARAELAGNIEVTIKGVIDNYFQDMTVGDQQEFVGRYEGLTREVINQELRGTRIICEQVTRTPEGRYKTYLAIELGGEELLTSINQRLSNDDRLRTNYEYERFREEFNREMQNMAR